VTDWIQAALSVLSLLLALMALVYVVLDRVADRWLVGAAGVVLLGTLVALVDGVIVLIGTDREVSAATFVGYLIGLVLIPPAATLWALGERSRGGTAVLIVAGLLIPFMLLRLDMIWTAHA
jgi:hypothetical protein